MSAWLVLNQPVVGMSSIPSTSTDRSASASDILGGKQMSQEMDVAPLRVVPMDYYEEMFNEMASKWYGEGAIFQSLGIMELQQSQQTITPKELGLMNPNYQLLPVTETEAEVVHRTATSTLTTTPVKKPKTNVAKLKTTATVQSENKYLPVGAVPYKWYKCHLCPYAAVDRKDLLTRHSLIHSGEKRFQCFICFKQFYRADHCKKHFNRMHKDTPYDLQKIKKSTAEQVCKDTARDLNNSTTSEKTTVSQQDHVMQQGSTTESKVYPIFAVHQQRQSRPVTVTAAQSSSSKKTFGRMHRNAPYNLQKVKKPAAEQVNRDGARILKKSTPPTTTVVSLQNRIVQQLSTTAPSPTTAFEVTTSQVPLDTYLAYKQQQQHQSKASASLAAYPSTSSGVVKKKSKNYSCNYCTWQGKDNWHLKRHLSTHSKPYFCVFCNYRAARSERLVHHIFKVHNMWLCSKCFFVADGQDSLSQHKLEQHH